MKVITPAEAKINKSDIISMMLRGKVFIYPTDTIYGIGCSAMLPNAVNKIREIKERPDTPFSIIAPSKNWIRENCVITKEAEKWIEQLPGPTTLILKKKEECKIAEELAPGKDTIGVRIPQHWFSMIVREMDVPIVTTSVNKMGKTFMTSLEDLDDEIKISVDFIIDEGKKEGRPSKLVHLEGEEVEVKER